MRRRTEEEREYRHWDGEVRKGIKRLQALEQQRARLLAQRAAVDDALRRNRDDIAGATRAIESAEYERESAGAYLVSEV